MVDIDKARHEIEEHARECVKLAEQLNTSSELRDQLLQMAREWMQAMMDEEDETPSDGDDPTRKMCSSPSLREVLPETSQMLGQRGIDLLTFCAILLAISDGPPRDDAWGMQWLNYRLKSSGESVVSGE